MLKNSCCISGGFVSNKNRPTIWGKPASKQQHRNVLYGLLMRHTLMCVWMLLSTSVNAVDTELKLWKRSRGGGHTPLVRTLQSNPAGTLRMSVCIGCLSKSTSCIWYIWYNMTRFDFTHNMSWFKICRFCSLHHYWLSVTHPLSLSHSTCASAPVIILTTCYCPQVQWYQHKTTTKSNEI